MTFRELKNKILEVFPDFYVDWEKYRSGDETIRRVIILPECILKPQDDLPMEEWQVISTKNKDS